MPHHHPSSSGLMFSLAGVFSAILLLSFPHASSCVPVLAWVNGSGTYWANASSPFVYPSDALSKANPGAIAIDQHAGDVYVTYGSDVAKMSLEGGISTLTRVGSVPSAFSNAGDSLWMSVDRTGDNATMLFTQTFYQYQQDSPQLVVRTSLDSMQVLETYRLPGLTCFSFFGPSVSYDRLRGDLICANATNQTLTDSGAVVRANLQSKQSNVIWRCADHPDITPSCSPGNGLSVTPDGQTLLIAVGWSIYSGDLSTPSFKSTQVANLTNSGQDGNNVFGGASQDGRYIYYGNQCTIFQLDTTQGTPQRPQVARLPFPGIDILQCNNIISTLRVAY